MINPLLPGVFLMINPFLPDVVAAAPRKEQQVSDGAEEATSDGGAQSHESLP